MLLRHNVDGGHASVIAEAVWNNSRDIRDRVKIGKLATSEEDLGFLVNMLEGYSEGVTKQNRTLVVKEYIHPVSIWFPSFLVLYFNNSFYFRF